MGKKRIYELAKELNTSNKSLVEKAQSLGFDVTNHMGAISETQEKQLRQSLQPKKTEGQTKSTNPTNTPEPNRNETIQAFKIENIKHHVSIPITEEQRVLQGMQVIGRIQLLKWKQKIPNQLKYPSNQH